MAYTSYELLPARTINNRIIPRLWKLIRSDGTFDLYSLASYQHNCVQYLASVNQAGVFCGRFDYDNIRNFGEYVINTNNSNFTRFSISMYDGTKYGSVPHCCFRMKLNNNANLYPYTISGYNYSDKNAGARILQVYNGSSWVVKTGGGYNQGNWGGGSNSDRKEATLWSMNLSNLSSVFDWKDYSELHVMFRAVDKSKFTGAGTSLSIGFIHRFTDGHPLHRYYR